MGRTDRRTEALSSAISTVLAANQVDAYFSIHVGLSILRLGHDWNYIARRKKNRKPDL
jgi:hypothetical protein